MILIIESSHYKERITDGYYKLQNRHSQTPVKLAITQFQTFRIYHPYPYHLHQDFFNKMNEMYSLMVRCI